MLLSHEARITRIETEQKPQQMAKGRKYENAEKGKEQKHQKDEKTIFVNQRLDT